jgi:hypothetical protein
MTAFDIADSIQSIGFLTYIRESGYTYPTIMATHLASIAVFGGMILMTDLRLLGVAMTDMSVTEVVRQLRTWKRIGFVLMVTMGLLLGLSEADKYYNNPYFWVKMTLLAMVGVHAIAFHRSVYGNTEAIDRAGQIPPIAKTAAVLSLCIWIGIASAGRWIAYYEPKKPGQKTVAALTTGDRVMGASITGDQRGSQSR